MNPLDFVDRLFSGIGSAFSRIGYLYQQGSDTAKKPWLRRIVVTLVLLVVLVGLIFLNPLLGMAAGAAAGAISGALTDVGVNDDFMKKIASGFNNGSSALFVLVRHMTPDKVLAELEGTGGKILQTSLTHEQETKLQAALSAAKPASEA